MHAVSRRWDDEVGKTRASIWQIFDSNYIVLWHARVSKSSPKWQQPTQWQEKIRL